MVSLPSVDLPWWNIFYFIFYLFIFYPGEIYFKEIEPETDKFYFSTDNQVEFISRCCNKIKAVL